MEIGERVGERSQNTFSNGFTKRIWSREGVEQMDLVIGIIKVIGGRI